MERLVKAISPAALFVARCVCERGASRSVRKLRWRCGDRDDPLTNGEPNSNDRLIGG